MARQCARAWLRLRARERGDIRVPYARRGSAGAAAATRTRTASEAEAAAALAASLDDARISFLRKHADDVYAALTDDLRRPVRDEELVYAAAERFPGLTPTRVQVATERTRPLPEKDGVEIAQGLFLSFVLASPRSGPHLVWAMLRPTDVALERLDEFRAPASPISVAPTSSGAAARRFSRSATTAT